MTDTFDGGPAFPCQHDGSTRSDAAGISMRDYFAASAALLPFRGKDGALDLNCAKAIMADVPQPSGNDDAYGCLVWWAEADARLRMLSADAMLRARKVAP